MARLFERQYVNLNRRDRDGRTPLSQAAASGHDGVVELLLGRKDVSPGRPDNRGNTPLALATRWGHTRVVELLMVRGTAAPRTILNS